MQRHDNLQKKVTFPLVSFPDPTNPSADRFQYRYSVFPSSCNIRLQEQEPCHPIKLQKDLIWSSQVDKIMNSKFEGQIKSSWEICLWENYHSIRSYYRQISFSISSCRNLLANPYSIPSSLTHGQISIPFRVANYCSTVGLQVLATSGCNSVNHVNQSESRIQILQFD